VGEKSQVNQRATQSNGSRFFWNRSQLAYREVTARYAIVLLVGRHLPQGIRPGQFVLVRYTEDPCLPRAFSVMSSSTEGIKLFVKTEGRVREKFSTSPLGTEFDVRGPYGTAYEDKVSMDREYVLVGGGSGAAPLLYFHASYPDCVARTVYGFRTEDAQELLPDTTLAIESLGGAKADVETEAVWRPGLGIIACGPEAMLRLLARRYRGQPDVYVSLESRIGCGIGTCLGCSIETSRGMQRICREGPLFALEELPWLN